MVKTAMLPMQETQVQFLVRELDPTWHNQQLACHKEEIPHAATKTWCKMKSETQNGKYIHNTPDGRLVPRVYDEEMGTEQGPQWTNASAGAQSVLRKDSSEDPHTQARKSPGQPTVHLAAPSGQLPSLKPRRLSKEGICCLRCNPWSPPQRLRREPRSRRRPR